MDGANTVGRRVVWKDGMPRSQKSQGTNNGHSRSGIHALPTVESPDKRSRVSVKTEEPETRPSTVQEIRHPPIQKPDLIHAESSSAD